MIQLKRIYLEYNQTDGARVLVDRLWPRGVSKEKARLDLWLKDIAPSDELRKWFHHDQKKWEEFQQKYKKELQSKTAMLEQLKELHKKQKTLTLLYGATDSEHNHAVVIASLLK